MPQACPSCSRRPCREWTANPPLRLADTLRLLVLFAAIALLAGCASSPRTNVPSQRDQGAAIAALALAQVGQPYRYGGDAREGFDCSGLTRFVHAQQSIALPRTARLQRESSKSLSRRELAPGDLVFFRMLSRQVDHVGVYIGDGKFVHAPRPGSSVAIATLDAPWFLQHFAGGGRYWKTLQKP